MPQIVVSPLPRIAEMAVRYGCREMLSLLAQGQSFHRPAVITTERHLVIDINDVTFGWRKTADGARKRTDGIITPQEHHVRSIIDFARGWDHTAPLLIHCWMGVSRSPAAAIIAALAIAPDQNDATLAHSLRRTSPQATPNALLIEIADHVLARDGRLVDAIARIGRGEDADGNAPFVLSVASPHQTVGAASG